MDLQQPQPEHQWLQRLVGNWTYEGESIMGPEESSDQKMAFRGTEVVRPFGQFWVVAEGQESDGNSQSLMTLGFDPEKKSFVATFVSSMGAHLWTCQGSLNEARTFLTLDARGPSFQGGKMANYQDKIEILSEDHRTMTSQYQNDDGTWTPFMIIHYRRQAEA